MYPQLGRNAILMRTLHNFDLSVTAYCQSLRVGSLDGRIVRLEPMAEAHREGLREAAEREPQIHRYTNMYTLGFDRWFDLAVAAETEVPWVVIVGGRPVGSTRYLNVEPLHRRMEIGWTWLERSQWGTG